MNFSSHGSRLVDGSREATARQRSRLRMGRIYGTMELKTSSFATCSMRPWLQALGLCQVCLSQSTRPCLKGLHHLLMLVVGLEAWAKAFPHIKCSVLDLPHVVASCKGTENLEFVAGDMFQAIPSADALLLKGILHDWNDEDSLKILKRCREAIGSSEKGGKLIILDIMMDSKATREIAELQLFFDMLMMVNTNGIERSEREWEKLFNEAGFTSYKITSISSFRTVIEAFP
ncbi:hypothetical protein Syun_008585 [Stephania yunnanensis]|uniref:O-methyltransferase C-terminal domain-containing protein n=1 Tax=Stephania yunnanensis TaxID=152371 RepID=A0AAP0KCU8_9MAGN